MKMGRAGTLAIVSSICGAEVDYFFRVEIVSKPSNRNIGARIDDHVATKVFENVSGSRFAGNQTSALR
jgi:hypothetical protein